MFAETDRNTATFGLDGRGGRKADLGRDRRARKQRNPTAEELQSLHRGAVDTGGEELFQVVRTNQLRHPVVRDYPLPIEVHHRKQHRPP